MSTLGTWSHDLTKKYMECSTQYLLTLSCQFASAGREMVSTAVVWHLHLKHHPSLPPSIAPSSPICIPTQGGATQIATLTLDCGKIYTFLYSCVFSFSSLSLGWHSI